MSEELKTYCCEHNRNGDRIADYIAATSWDDAEAKCAKSGLTLAGEFVESIPCDSPESILRDTRIGDGPGVYVGWENIQSL